MTFFKCDTHDIKKHTQVKVILAFTIESVRSCFLIHYMYTYVKSLVMLGQETNALVAEHFVHLITLDTPLILSAFIARRRTGLLSCHLQEMIFLE